MLRSSLSGIICAALIVGLALAAPVHANLTLFPDAVSFGLTPIVDGGPGDASGVVNGQIVIDTPIDVPGTGGDITFMGLVEEVLIGPIVNNLPSERYIRITEIPTGLGYNNAGSPAALTNITANTFNLGPDVRFVQLPYTPQLANWPGPGQIPTLNLYIDGWVDAPGGLTGTERIEMQVMATTQWPALGQTLTGGWTNPGQTTGPVNFSSPNSVEADFDGDPGEIRLELTTLDLGPNASFYFPTSIVAGSAVPEPSSLVLLTAAAGLMMLGRRR
jgi:hypothetical protein